MPCKRYIIVSRGLSNLVSLFVYDGAGVLICKGATQKISGQKNCVIVYHTINGRKKTIGYSTLYQLIESNFNIQYNIIIHDQRLNIKEKSY